MKVNPYLNFHGTCEEAFTFYEAVLGGKISNKMTYADTPMPPPEGWGNKIAHIRLDLGETIIMGSDSPPQHQQKPAGFAVTINVDDPEKADSIFAALEEGGQVGMPIQKTFWAQKFGMVTDKYGTPWMVNCE